VPLLEVARHRQSICWVVAFGNGTKPHHTATVDLACGEGRNAIWLARRGWTVTGVDFSDTAIGKARHLAEKAQVTVNWVCEDVIDREPEADSFDLVVICYLHLPHEAMSRVLGHARRALAESGWLFVVGHARANLASGIADHKIPASSTNQTT